MSTITCPHCKGTGHPYDPQEDEIQEHLHCDPCNGTGVLDDEETGPQCPACSGLGRIFDEHGNNGVECEKCHGTGEPFDDSEE